MTSRLVCAVPTLASLNLAETRAFFERLGFAVDFEYPDYLGIHRDGVRSHFWLCNERHIAENTSCWIEVSGVDALYAEFKAHGVIHPNGALEDKSWRMREFSILDCHGNLLRFGEPVAGT
jgi:hypothetical protein